MSNLVARQSALVAALVAGGPAPDGFDIVRLDLARRELLGKRAGLAATTWPRLAASLGDGWLAAFAARFDGVPPTDSLREGWDFARELYAHGALSADAVAELVYVENVLFYDGDNIPEPRPRPSPRNQARTDRLLEVGG